MHWQAYLKDRRRQLASPADNGLHMPLVLDSSLSPTKDRKARGWVLR